MHSHSLALFGLILFSLPLVDLAPASAKPFRGAWFEVEIPKGFSVAPSIPSPSLAGTFDSAFFRSPDGRVEFYVFSPQWGGESPDIAFDGARERAEKPTVERDGGRVVTRTTFVAKDGSYTRTYQETREETVRWVVGLKYATSADLDRHRPAYLKFKASLRQFAD